jgi:hypothetical protein
LTWGEFPERVWSYIPRLDLENSTEKKKKKKGGGEKRANAYRDPE